MSDLKKVDISSLTFKTRDKIVKYLLKLVEAGGSDLHVKSNSIIRARIHGKIMSIGENIFTKEEGISLAKEMLRGRFAELVENKEVDFVFETNNVRFRVNMFFQMDGVSAVFRNIPNALPAFETLGLPKSISNLIENVHTGIVLVTGGTGSGKSTTLASIVNAINKKYSKHIITIEDPIEFVYKDDKSIITQRSVGQDTLSFNNALRAALREDPDIILVGEMRDTESISLALKAAETGHLVFSTLHTIDAKETISRLISAFPPDAQNKIRHSLASILRAVLSQRLIPTIDSKRVLAMECLYQTPFVQELIASSRDSEILEAIEKGGAKYGTQSFDQCLLNLVQNKKISIDIALENATSSSDLKLRFSYLTKDGEGNSNIAPIGLIKES